jgi:hypothetical protein
MKTIQTELADIKNSATLIEGIVTNYKCGFITLTEMLAQIDDVQRCVELSKEAIANEYGINRNAVNLMLTL